MKQEEVDGKAGGEDSFGKERRRLSLGRLTIHTHSMPSAVTFVRHSTHSLVKTHMCRHHKAQSTLQQIQELKSRGKYPTPPADKY